MVGLKILWEILEPRCRKKLVFLALLTAVSSCFELFGLGAVIPFIAVASSASPFGAQSEIARYALSICARFGATPHNLVIVLGLVLLLGVTVSNILQVGYQYVTLKIIYSQYRDMSIRLVKNFAGRSLDWYGQQNSSDLSQTLMNEVLTVTTGAILPAVQCAGLLLRLFFTATFFFFIQPRTAIAIALSLTGAYLFVFRIVRERMLQAGQTRFFQMSKMYRVSQELFQGAREIRVTGTARNFVRLFERATSQTVGPLVLRGLPPHVTRAALETATVGLTIGLVVFYRQADGNLANGLPLLSAYALAGIRLMPVVQQAFYNVMDIRFNLPAVQNLVTFFGDHPNIDAPDQSQDGLSFNEAIQFRSVSFSYPACPPVIRDVSLNIQKMQRVAFVGPTGAGKSTILDLLLQLRFPSQGCIMVDQLELRPENASKWQKDIGYVPQSIFLTDSSVRENVALGIPEDQILDEDVIKACKAASLHDFIINELPDGYATVIGERGSRFSGGQSQRLGIARALYHDPPVIVFDEATSSLDNATESSILQSLDSLKGKKTLIVVAHRLNTVWDFDQIFVIENGQLVGAGTSAELRLSCPTFQTLLHSSTSMASDTSLSPSR